MRGGHPWVFSESVRESSRPGRAGELAVIYDRHDRFLAVGMFDPDSPIRVRILHRGKPRRIDAEWFRENLERSVALRAGHFDADTTGYRLVNGESDGWPGLVLDRYAGTLVLKLYSLGWVQRIGTLRDLLDDVLTPERIVLRLSRNIQDASERECGHRDGEILSGPPVVEVPIFSEAGVRFEADVVRGQKTGFFLDQRENRLRIGTLSEGRRVLNAFSFSGGFSLHAARGGAVSVADLDLSAHALESAKRNFALNGCDHPVIASCVHESIRADAFAWLASPAERQFDLIVLDPPSLARREAERTRAITAYGRLVVDAIRWLAPGGVLFAGSCSAHVDREEFFGAVRGAARASRRRFAEEGTTGHALDHPATFPEAHYLKGIYLRFL